MQVSTSTCISDNLQGHPDCAQTLQLCSEAGFRVMDMNLATYSRGDAPLCRNDWMDWAVRMRALADSLDIRFTQTHAHFYRWMAIPEQDLEWHEELVRRSIIASGIFGDVWMVTHPNSAAVDGTYSRRETLRRNVEYYRRYADLARKHGVHIAIENLFVIRGSCYFGLTAEDLLELIDRLDNDPIFGVCWDFGHAYLERVDQANSLRQIGSKLHALHVDDNFGQSDEHFAPFFGKIEWEPLMKVLKEIDYQGDFTYEIHHFVHDLPIPLQVPCLKFIYELGTNMIQK